MNISNFKINIGKGLKLMAVSFMMACGSDTSSTNPSDSADVPTTVESDSKNDNGFYDIPSPVLQVQLLQKAGATYDRSNLNPLDNISKYVLNNSKALNLGVYGADLSYAAVFNQQEDAILYLNASNKLAEALSIKGDFYLKIITRMEKNYGNKDSLLQIVSDIYRKSNEALKENDQSQLSALVVVGSFIEAMYIGTQSAKIAADKKAIYDRIGKSKSTLNNLIALIATVHDDGFPDLLAELKLIKAIYDEAPEGIMTEEQMAKLTKQIAATRIRITNM